MPLVEKTFTNRKRVPKNYTGIALFHSHEGKICKEWYRNGELHRADGPAIIHEDGPKSWWRHGELHRVKGPAIEYTDGTREWYLKGKLHRVGGPAIERVNNTNEWWFEGMLHRTDGPAIVSSFYAEWWYYDQIVYRITLKEDYITLEEGLPCSIIWDKNPITQKKVLTSSGIKYIPNLPGI